MAKPRLKWCTMNDYVSSGQILRPSGPNGQPDVVGEVIGGRWVYFADEPPTPTYPELVDELVELPEHRTRRFYTVSQLGRPMEIQWLVKEWIARGELSVIYGPGDSYKSFLALHWGLLAAFEGASVVYIAGEGAHGLRTRVPAWLRHHEIAADEVDGFRVDELPVMLDNSSERQAWLAEVEDELSGLPDWIIVDTLSMCFAGDENSPQDMNRFVRNLEQMRRARSARTAITVIHHTPVGKDRERGTAALRNATFSMVKLSGKAPRGFSVQVACDRMKDAKRPETVRMYLERVAWSDVSSLACDRFTPAGKSTSRGKES